jgi:hypothetical protein
MWAVGDTPYPDNSKKILPAIWKTAYGSKFDVEIIRAFTGDNTNLLPSPH